ncbi:MAG: hypothetical protein JNL82_01820 [Myxococcales bacterium]|nr:hypothetical protein [Myxococcales bacterium]
MTLTDTTVPASRPEAAARPRRRRLSRALALAATVATSVVASNAVAPTAEAAVPRVLRPGTRPMQFLFGFGPSFGIGGSRWVYGYCYGNGNCDGRYYYGGYGRYGGAFKLSQEFNYHFSGNASGPALGVLLNEEFSGPYFGFNIAPKFTYDIQPKRDLGLYISPSVSFGYHLDHYASYWYTGNPYAYNYHAANLQFGVALKLSLGDRGVVFLQLPNFDFVIGPGGYYRDVYGGCPPGYGCGAYFRAKLDVMFGGGVAF